MSSEDQNRREELQDALLRRRRRPESRSVRKMELRTIPLLASVALASRCVRRVQPLFRTFPDTKDREALHQAIDKAAEMTEAVAAGVRTQGMDKEIAGLAELAKRVSGRVLPPPADQVAYAVGCAADAAAGAIAGDAEKTINDAATAFSVTAKLVSLRNAVAEDVQAAGDELEKLCSGQFDDMGADEMRDAIATDYEKLLTLDLGADSPVDPRPEGPLGPLWPDGAPAWYQPLT
jgi:hypothetical protein